MTSGPPVTSPWSRHYAATTVGILALTVVWSFESLAVSSIMPAVAAALHGLKWYAISFAASTAASAVSFVVAGAWIDRRGSFPAITVGCLGFASGLLVCGLAPTMPVFLLGRTIQGLDGGAMVVALYVVIAESFPITIRSAAFHVLTVGWVLPALLGPAAAAQTAETFGWRPVFLAVPVLTFIAWLLVRRGRIDPGPAARPRAALRAGHSGVARAGLAAGEILVIGYAGQRSTTAWPVMLVAGVGSVVFAAVRLLPPGTWTLRPGVPSVLATRGLLSAAFSGAETYVPLLLITDRHVSIGTAGWFLAAGSVAWCLASWAIPRIPSLADPVRGLRLGALAGSTGILGFVVLTLTGASLLWAGAAWCLCGAGVGLAYVTATVLSLDASPPTQAGRVSASLQLCDALTQALVLSAGSVVFNVWVRSNPPTGAAVAGSLAAAVGALAFVSAGRIASLARC